MRRAAKPSVMGTYLLLAGDSGEPLAGFDGMTLTLWRTAAASALAAGFLARPEARRMAMIGAGALAPRLIAAHAAVRPITQVTIWNRTPEAAERLAAALDRPGLAVTATRDREAAVREADIVSVATMSREPLVEGAWLKPGAHVDLVGAYTPEMREADDAAIRRARVYVDTRGGALKEAGDIVQPLAAGVIGEADIAGDLFDLCRGAVPGRRSDEEITLFKSVGSAIEDLGRGDPRLAPAFRLKPRFRPFRTAACRSPPPAVGLLPRFMPNPAPMSLIVKICGLSNEETLDAALAAGADMVGFNFFPKSPRFVTPARAAELAKRVAGRAEIVAVTVDMDDAALAEIVETVSPDWLQLHGSETPERVAEVRPSASAVR